MRKRLGKERHRRLTGKSLYGILANALTVGFFAISLTCIWLGGDDFWRVVSRLGVSGLLVSLALCMLVVGFGRLVWTALAALVSRNRSVGILFSWQSHDERSSCGTQGVSSQLRCHRTVEIRFPI